MVVAVRDQEARVAELLVDARRTLCEVAEQWELLVVDDGSTDQTAVVVREAAREDRRIRLLIQADAFGRGAALRRGFDAARYMVVLSVAPTCARYLGVAPDLFGDLHNADLVSVSRARPTGLLATWRWSAFAWLQRRTLGLIATDPDSPMQMMRGSLLRLVELDTDGDGLELEVLRRTQDAGLRWVEVTVSGLGSRPPRPPFATLWRLRKRL